jgi:hypothetical protein
MLASVTASSPRSSHHLFLPGLRSLACIHRECIRYRVVHGSLRPIPGARRRRTFCQKAPAAVGAEPPCHFPGFRSRLHRGRCLSTPSFLYRHYPVTEAGLQLQKYLASNGCTIETVTIIRERSSGTCPFVSLFLHIH